MTRIAACLLALSAALPAQSLSQGERDYCLSELHATRKLFIDTVSGLSEAQMKWKPEGGGWSAAEVAEHIALSEQAIPQLVRKALDAPATPEKKKANPRETDYALVKNVPVRDKKAQAPDIIQPKGQLKGKDAILAAFKEARDRNLAYVRETKEDVRSHFAPHPVFGELDALQWYILIGAHTERHVNQIRELMTSPGFPKQ